MANEIKVFENTEFGKVRMVLIENEPYFVGKDVANILGYSDENKAVAMHVDEEDKKLNDKTSPSFGQRGTAIINESGLYSLILSPKLPTAKKFKHWVTAEVLPTIRKTGSYSIKQDDNLKAIRAKTMELNAKSRQSKLWLQIAAQASLPAYKQIATAYAANTLANKRVFELPLAEKRTYSATEIGTLLGVSSNKIGIIANKNKLKTDIYGALFLDKSRHSSKEVETFRYYENAIPVFRNLLGVQ